MDAILNPPLTEDNAHRLIKAIMQKRTLNYDEAEKVLGQLRLSLVCGEKIRTSAALQASLLTAVNTGKRAFLGGVFISMPENVKLLLPWPNKTFLNEVVSDLGGRFDSNPLKDLTFSLHFGIPALNENSLEVICNGWIGGISPHPIDVLIPHEPDFALGGILSAGLGVGCAFLRISGLDNTAGFRPLGLSLWRPDLNWLDKEALTGPKFEHFPKKIWFLGLGHLGQAFLWSLGLLPISHPGQAEFLLQDFDRVKKANFSTGLLSEEIHIGEYKTRICSDWLKARGFTEVKITERRFDQNTKRRDEEPLLALCGFDSIEPRRWLEDAGFDTVIECGLGASIEDFDSFAIHAFPGSRKAKNIWSASQQQQPIDSKLVEAFGRSVEKKNGCGIIALNLAQKAIAGSFVGCVAGTIVISELLRGWHEGVINEALSGQLRGLSDIYTAPSQNGTASWAKNGYIAMTH